MSNVVFKCKIGIVFMLTFKIWNWIIINDIHVIKTRGLKYVARGSNVARHECRCYPRYSQIYNKWSKKIGILSCFWHKKSFLKAIFYEEIRLNLTQYVSGRIVVLTGARRDIFLFNYDPWNIVFCWCGPKVIWVWDPWSRLIYFQKIINL